jgi:sulfur carrier protein ThiS
MAVAVSIPEALRRYVDNRAQVQVAAGPLESLVAEIAQKYPALKLRLLQPDGSLMAHLVLALGGELVPAADILDTVAQDGDLLEILFVASGG